MTLRGPSLCARVTAVSIATAVVALSLGHIHATVTATAAATADVGAQPPPSRPSNGDGPHLDPAFATWYFGDALDDASSSVRAGPVDTWPPLVIHHRALTGHAMGMSRVLDQDVSLSDAPRRAAYCAFATHYGAMVNAYAALLSRHALPWLATLRESEAARMSGGTSWDGASAAAFDEAATALTDGPLADVLALCAWPAAAQAGRDWRDKSVDAWGTLSAGVLSLTLDADAMLATSGHVVDEGGSAEAMSDARTKSQQWIANVEGPAAHELSLDTASLALPLHAPLWSAAHQHGGPGTADAGARDTETPWRRFAAMVYPARYGLVYTHIVEPSFEPNVWAQVCAMPTPGAIPRGSLLTWKHLLALLTVSVTAVLALAWILIGAMVDRTGADHPRARPAKSVGADGAARSRAVAAAVVAAAAGAGGVSGGRDKRHRD